MKIVVQSQAILSLGAHSRYWMIGCLDPEIEDFGSMNYLIDGAPSETTIARNCLETFN